MKKNRVEETINKILDEFKSGNIPEKVSLAMFPRYNAPCNKWSFRNRLLVALADTNDARGFNQWRQVERFVKKGTKAFYILVPCHKKFVDEKTGEEIFKLFGFKSVPVYRYEDTLGKKIEFLEIKIPDFHFKNVAEKWGVTIKTIPGNDVLRGCYIYNSLFGEKKIEMATPEQKTFFHELSHAAHHILSGEKFKKIPSWKKEIVAEFSAQVLLKISGVEKEKNTLGNSYEYILGYSKGNVISDCLSLLNDINSVVSLILEESEVKGK